MKNIFLYPSITKSLFDEMKPNIEFKYSYKYNGYYIDLEPNNIAKTIIQLEDRQNDGEWDYKEYGLKVKGKISLFKPYYYLKSRKIIVKNTTVGVAISWYSTDAKLRGSTKIGNLNDDIIDNIDHFEFEIDFRSKQLLSKVDFELVFYIEEPGDADYDEKYIANEKGIMLGKFYLHQIQFDGIGSLFPIYTVEKPNSPLWEISINIFESPLEDSFSEAVKIMLNTAHPAFQYIDYDSRNTDTFNKYFFFEIIASAMATLMLELKNSDEKYLDNLDEKFVPGSVMHAIKYFVDTLGWECDSAESINRSIREFFDKKSREM